MITTALKIALALGFAAAIMLHPPVSGADELSPGERRGRQIYRKGEDGARGEIKAVLNGDLEMPATSFPCANCHGRRGEGGNEGGLQPPPLNWEALVAPGMGGAYVFLSLPATSSRQLLVPAALALGLESVRSP